MASTALITGSGRTQPIQQASAVTISKFETVDGVAGTSLTRLRCYLIIERTLATLVHFSYTYILEYITCVCVCTAYVLPSLRALHDDGTLEAAACCRPFMLTCVMLATLSNSPGLPWDVVHFNFGLHDLETSGVGGPYAVRLYLLS